VVRSREPSTCRALVDRAALEASECFTLSSSQESLRVFHDPN
jgi:hypothetical protein